MIKFQMPSLGADMEDGTLIEWKIKPGDKVQRGDIIAEVETQKGLIEIEVFDEGTVSELLVKEGSKVPIGTVMALIQSSKTALDQNEEKIIKEKGIDLQPIEEKTTAQIPVKEEIRMAIKASPLARRIAEENNISLSQIKGTGPEGAITREDVEQFILQNKQPKTAILTDKSNVQTVAIRAATAAAMSKSNREIPHYYLEKKIDVTKTLSWLKELNKNRAVEQRLLPVVLFLKAVAQSLKDFPDLNAIWDNGLQPKKDINIGFVVALRTGGIMVPALHEVDLKNCDEIMETLNDIIPRARALKLRSSDLSDSTITITNIGEGGADSVYGIIYPPQVAIIGFGAIAEYPFAENGMIGIRSTVSVTLAGDHRATDGLTGSRFLQTINKHLQNPENL
ncbi:dihydrolipoamide acetyltransferase family protein [Flavobacterium sp. WC2430]|uniref:dihydrolipoamide acetyltransferase family protein n=1 Tax=Flavobacterium sp. WC2430 TaxID=3234137 RepID=UPI003465D5A7